MFSAESRRYLRHLAALQAMACAGLVFALLLVAPNAAWDAFASAAIVLVAVLASGAYALGGGVQAAESAAFRAVAATIGRWVLALAGLTAMAAREGAVVWAVALGAVVAYAAYAAATVTFRRI